MMLVVYVHVFTMLFIHVLYAYSNLFRFRVYIFYTGVSMSTYKYTVSCLLFNDLFTTRSLIHQTHLLHVCILWFKLKVSYRMWVSLCGSFWWISSFYVCVLYTEQMFYEWYRFIFSFLFVECKGHLRGSVVKRYVLLCLLCASTGYDKG